VWCDLERQHFGFRRSSTVCRRGTDAEISAASERARSVRAMAAGQQLESQSTHQFLSDRRRCRATRPSTESRPARRC